MYTVFGKTPPIQIATIQQRVVDFVYELLDMQTERNRQQLAYCQVTSIQPIVIYVAWSAVCWTHVHPAKND